MLKTKGFLAINKPQNWTSFDVVNKVKHLLKTKTVGHLGTLDPMATGVLVLTIGKATKLFDLMQEKRKTYLASFEFGYLTDSLDATGEKLAESKIIPTLAEINEKLPKFIGKIAQIPPKYSAKSVGGVRAYTLARQNVDFELPAKEVEIYSIHVLDYHAPKLKLKIECGSGTYIRAIGRDLASELGSFATMTELTRTTVGNFDLKNSYEIADLNETNIWENVLKIDDVLDYSKLELKDFETKKLLNGQSIKVEKTDGIYKICDENDCFALIKIKNFSAKMILYLG